MSAYARVAIAAAATSVALVFPGSVQAAPAPAVQGVGYAGETAQGLPVALILTNDRKKIKRFDMPWVALPAQCSSGMPYVSATTFGAGSTPALAIGAGKRFRHTFTDAFTFADATAIEEVPTVRGTIGRTRASGTFRATAVVRDAAGTELTRCDTGAIRWTALQ